MKLCSSERNAPRLFFVTNKSNFAINQQKVFHVDGVKSFPVKAIKAALDAIT